MSAKEMFEKLGYALKISNDKELVFYYKGSIGLSPYEHKNTKPHFLYGTDKEIIFNKKDKDFIIYSPTLMKDYEDCSVYINIQELETINKQVEELWGGNNEK